MRTRLGLHTWPRFIPRFGRPVSYHRSVLAKSIFLSEIYHAEGEYRCRAQDAEGAGFSSHATGRKYKRKVAKVLYEKLGTILHSQFILFALEDGVRSALHAASRRAPMLLVT